jgi:O-methyltransferase
MAGEDRTAEHALDGGDDTASAFFRRAGRLARLARWDQALPLYEALAEDAPDYPGVFQALGDAQAELGLSVPAAQSYLRALAGQPRNTVLLLKLSDLQRRCGDVEGAEGTAALATRLKQSGEDHDVGTRLPPMQGRDLDEAYLDLMKDCLTFLLWDASDGPALELNARRPLVSLARLLQRAALKREPAPRSVREMGQDWPAQALTMLGKTRLDNIQTCVERVLQDDIPGDLIEAGVWRGGGAIFMRAALRAYGETGRKVWVADSFKGLPRPDVETYPADRGYDLSVWRTLAVSADEVRENFRRFHLLDDQVAFLEGWFAETLPTAPIERLAVLRLDGDLYGSTWDALVHLYSKLSPGGFAIVDDYYNSPPCKQAVDDFRQRHGIDDDMVKVDWSAAYWRKS